MKHEIRDTVKCAVALIQNAGAGGLRSAQFEPDAVLTSLGRGKFKLLLSKIPDYNPPRLFGPSSFGVAAANQIINYLILMSVKGCCGIAG
jgi:hypothetical protein